MEKVGTQTEASSQSRVGGAIGKYQLIASLGAGGMAKVFLARQQGPLGFGKVVVLKVIHPHLANQKGFLDMLVDEARIAAQINHPGIVQTFDLGVVEGTFFIAMEYLAGEDLETIQSAGQKHKNPMDPYCVARIVAETAEGLHGAHNQTDMSGKSLEIIHRDVSPGNILVLYDGRVKVVDFGLARAEGRISKSVSGQVKGKIAYMSPEQIHGAPMDRRADIFSLGVVLWELLAQRPLFRRDNDAATLHAILAGDPPPPSSSQRGVPTALDKIALKALASNPRQRFQTALEMQVAIDRVLSSTRQRGTTTEIREYMHKSFASRMQKRQQLLEHSARSREESRGVERPAATPKPATSVEPKGLADVLFPDSTDDLAGDRPLDAKSFSGRLPSDITDLASVLEPDPPAGARPLSRQEPLAGVPHSQVLADITAKVATDGPLPAAASRPLQRRAEPAVARPRRAEPAVERPRRAEPAVERPRRAEPAVARPPREPAVERPRRSITIWLAVALAFTVGILATILVVAPDVVGALGRGNKPDSQGDLVAASSSDPAKEGTSPSSGATVPPVVAAGSQGGPNDQAASGAGRQDKPAPGSSASQARPAGPSAPGAEQPKIAPGVPADTTAPGTVSSGKTTTTKKPPKSADRKPPKRADRKPPKRADKPPESAEVAKKADPAQAKPLYDQGIRLFMGGKLKEAKEKFEESLQANRSYAPAYRGLGLLYLRQGKRKPAAKALGRYLKLAPGAGDAEGIRQRIEELEGE